MDKENLENYIQTIDQLYYYKSTRLFNEFYYLNLKILKENKKDSIHHNRIRKYELKSKNPDFFIGIYQMEDIMREVLEINFFHDSEKKNLMMLKSRCTGIEELDKVEIEMKGIRFRDMIKNALKLQPAYLISGRFNLMTNILEINTKSYVSKEFYKDIVGPSILQFSYQKKKFDSKESKKRV